MSVIFDIMKDEHARLLAVIDLYKAAIVKEVAGSSQLKRIGNNFYLYLEKRVGSKVVFEYVDNMESDKAIRVQESIKKRKEYEALLKQSKAHLKDVKKVLRGKI
jgi:hypothetical protein